MTSNLRPMPGLLRGLGQTPEGRMTEVQAVELRALSERLGEPFDAELTQRQAEARLRDLRARLED